MKGPTESHRSPPFFAFVVAAPHPQSPTPGSRIYWEQRPRRRTNRMGRENTSKREGAKKEEGKEFNNQHHFPHASDNQHCCDPPRPSTRLVSFVPILASGRRLVEHHPYKIRRYGGARCGRTLTRSKVNRTKSAFISVSCQQVPHPMVLWFEVLISRSKPNTEAIYT